MAVLMTGGAGYIGSHTCVAALEAGEEILLLDNFANAKETVADRISEISGKSFPVYRGNLLNEDDIRRVFRKNDIEAVIHFAGLKAVGESVEKPLEYYRNNLSATLNLCMVMAEYGCNTMVFSSSATVYGKCPVIPYKEEYPLSATSPYGASKVMIEQILSDICVSRSEWSVAILRYFNPIGAHPSGLIGEDPQGIPNNLMPYIAKVAAGVLPELSIYGNDYATRDGTGVRDYIHVVDLARGHIDALRYARDHKGAEAFNLGAGRGYSVLEVVRIFEEVTGQRVNYKFCPRRPGDIAEFYADPTKAKRLLGWSTELDIEDMCRDTWNFMTADKQS